MNHRAALFPLLATLLPALGLPVLAQDPPAPRRTPLVRVDSLRPRRWGKRR